MHILKLHIMTRTPEPNEEFLRKATDLILERVPEVKEEELKPILHDETCVYRGFEVNEL